MVTFLICANHMLFQYQNQEKTWINKLYNLCSYYRAYAFSLFLRPFSVADADIIFLPCGLFYLLFSWHNLSRCRLDICHTCTRRVALARTYVWNVLHTGSLKIQDTNKRRKKSPSRHHRTTLSGWIFAIKERIDSDALATFWFQCAE